MSYRTFKRVLGETSLERKCRWWFGISLAVMLLVSFTWYQRETDKQVERSTQELARELVRAGLLEIHLEHLGEMERGPAKGDSVAGDLENRYDTDFYRAFNESARDLKLGRDFEWRALKPHATGAEVDYLDDTEQQLIEALQRVSTDEEIDQAEIKRDRVHTNEEGDREYLYYHPLRASGDCRECHNKVLGEDWKEGDLMAVGRITINHQPTVDAKAKNQALAWTQAVVVGALSMLSLWAIVRYVIVKPVTHLRDISNAVRQGDTDQRAQIRTGDEFEELGAAFNRMLRQLLSQQEELQIVNEELDSRLDELAQANMRLFEMNRLKGDFLATVSHELRTPLNSIIGFSDVLTTIDTLSDKQRRYATNIQRSGRILLDMIDDILDLAKVENGKMDVKPSEFGIGAVVAAQCDMARPLTERKNIDLVHTVDPDLPSMFQDQAKVQQILNNLLSNAIKFTPEGGRIDVKVDRHPGGDMQLAVSDTGVGISEEEQSLVFEKFRQGTSAVPGADAMTREHSGTGLGLSIVRELCRLLGGEVALQSELGKGSSFCVHLPWQLETETRFENPKNDELEALTRPLPGVAISKRDGQQAGNSDNVGPATTTVSSTP
jgi:two-component system sensor histidine kinase BarA